MPYVLCTTWSDRKWIFCTLVMDLQYSKALFPHILVSFSKLIDFTISSLQKKWLWSLSFFLKWPSLEIPPILRFRFDSIAQNENAESAEIFRFLISSGDFYQTARSDTILILETLELIPLRCFSVKTTQFRRF